MWLGTVSVCNWLQPPLWNGIAVLKGFDPVFADLDLPQHPGAALLIIDHDERLYSKCCGFADWVLSGTSDPKLLPTIVRCGAMEI
jgi:hypothetical protein